MVTYKAPVPIRTVNLSPLRPMVVLRVSPSESSGLNPVIARIYKGRYQKVSAFSFFYPGVVEKRSLIPPHFI